MTARTWATKTRRLPVLTLMCILICLGVLLSGCGLQTDQANEYLQQATKHQEEAEAILLRFKAFPNDWQTIFSGYGVSQGEVDQARQLIQGREQDLIALDQALKAWKADLQKILKLDVEMEIKEYVRLKIQAINAWRDYADMSLKPLIAAYSGMVDIIASGGSAAQQDAKAQEITGLVSESVQKLEECQAAEKQAEDYFEKNKLGRQ
jgi:hypothetical protein